MKTLPSTGVMGPVHREVVLRQEQDPPLHWQQEGRQSMEAGELGEVWEGDETVFLLCFVFQENGKMRSGVRML